MFLLLIFIIEVVNFQFLLNHPCPVFVITYCLLLFLTFNMLSSASLANDQSAQWGVTNSALRQTYLKAINLLSLIFKIFVMIKVVNFSVAPHSSMSCLCYTCSFLVFPLKKCTYHANDQSAQWGMTNSALRQIDLQASK